MWVRHPIDAEAKGIEPESSGTEAFLTLTSRNDVESSSPTRDTRLHNRLSTRRSRCAEAVLSRLQIAGVSRSRKYNSAHVSFDHYGDYLKWRKTFPDPTNSPACRAHTLAINCDLMPVEERWVQSFSSVERLIISQG